MQLIFQIPVIDLRQAMYAGETVSVWPSPDMNKAGIDEYMNKAPFVRNFGKIDSSPEGYYCNINCVKYSNISENGLTIENSKARIFNSFKRLYTDGIYTTRAEFGFTDNVEALAESDNLIEPLQITEILKHYMSLPLDVQDMGHTGENEEVAENGTIHPDNRRSVILGNLGSLLSKNYCLASTKNIGQSPGFEYVINGETCIALAYAVSKNILFPANSEKLDEFIVDGIIIKLYGYQWFFEKRTIKVWLFQLPGFEALKSKAIMLELQNKRANLFRLNAEKETIRILANNINTDNANPSLKSYIKKTPAKIFKKKRFSGSQDPVRNFALQSEAANVKFVSIEDLRKILDEYGLDNLKNLEQGMKTATPKKSILFISSSPSGLNTFDFGDQYKAISEALQSGSDRDYFTLLNIEPAVEKDKVMQKLYTKKPDYLHITLHASKINGLYFQGIAKNPDPIPAKEFADYIELLSELKKPEVIILCACNSLAHAEAIKQYCKYVMGTNFVFPEKAAVVYAEKFYGALFNGMDVRFCHKVAVQGLKYSNPPFEAIDDKEVYNIPELISVDQPS